MSSDDNEPPMASQPELNEIAEAAQVAVASGLSVYDTLTGLLLGDKPPVIEE